MKKFLFSSLFILFGLSLGCSTNLHAGRGSSFGGAFAGSMVGGMISGAISRPSGRGNRDSWRRYAQDLEERNRRLQREIDDLRYELRRLRNDNHRNN